MSQTRTAIQQAFLQLARENPADKITVTDIVTRAGINRNSFYYYFEDLPGMIEITVQELFERTILQNRPQTFQECVDALADIMSQNRSACMHLFRSRSRIDLQLYYHRVCGFVVRTFLESVEYLGKFHTPEQKEAIAQYYKCLLLGLMTEWMAGGMRGDVKKSFASMQKAAEVLYR
ncbi:TetR/AcrR family transcriptional regulator [Faecalibaculum rodentium]|jgi:AcrR family transcriptional regulator|uniref:TetR/AcrR family transcriptional regulator n=1 Tax=Faecalibaculum rodentium TaxID=1702221 RepID=UPI001F59ADE1|nr:TetR-like C-terminal domain-containing protein [Faecalibaculum rodentium]